MRAPEARRAVAGRQPDIHYQLAFSMSADSRDRGRLIFPRPRRRNNTMPRDKRAHLKASNRLADALGRLESDTPCGLARPFEPLRRFRAGETRYRPRFLRFRAIDDGELLHDFHASWPRPLFIDFQETRR